ncbi:hypothetical protein C8T65DRAFT_699905 [Cerioporus squamosus]|nr:hypothetical protein C8T65DRAFT_699905 [Cerioporus squamosus]
MTGAPAGPPPPSRDETCASCIEPSAAYCPCDPEDDDYVTGDIVVMRESIHAPIDLIFAASTQSTSGLTPALAPSNASRSAKSRTLKSRPAVVWNDDNIDTDEAGPDVSATMACLFASLEGLCTYQDLPDILKDHFGLPVSPHCEIREGVPHLHTSPEWRKNHIWLIGSPYKSSGQVLGRWQWEDENGERHASRSFRVEEKEFIKMRAVCEERMKGWMKLCVTNERYIAECKKEYDIFRKPMEWKKHLMTQSWVEQGNDSDDSGYNTGLHERQAVNKPQSESNRDQTETINSSSAQTVTGGTTKSGQLHKGDNVKPMAERIRGVFRRRGKGRGQERKIAEPGSSFAGERDEQEAAEETTGVVEDKQTKRSELQARSRAKWITRRGLGRSRGATSKA